MILQNLLVLSLCSVSALVEAAQRISPPQGAIAVQAGAAPASGRFDGINAALNALPNDGSSRIIFIYPGTYKEQVNITRPGPLTVSKNTTVL